MSKNTLVPKAGRWIRRSLCTSPLLPFLSLGLTQRSARLLAANDASLTVPATPRFTVTADPDIPSALPLPVPDPLPQLRAFSSLTFTHTRVTALPPGFRRAHEIRGYAGDYGVGILDFSLNMVVDTAAEAVEELQGSVSHWARGELTEFINEYVPPSSPGVVLMK